MKRKFRVIGKAYFDHLFYIDQIVTLVKVYPDGVYECSGFYFNTVIKQDIHPIDLVEIT